METYDTCPTNIDKTAAYDIAVEAIIGAPMSNLALGDNADKIRPYQNMMLLKKIEMPEILEASTQDTRSRNRLDSVSFSATRYA